MNAFVTLKRIKSERFLKQFIINNADISAVQIPKNGKLWVQIRNSRALEMSITTSMTLGCSRACDMNAALRIALQRIKDEIDNSIRRTQFIDETVNDYYNIVCKDVFKK